jgi:hypothetical protein
MIEIPIIILSTAIITYVLTTDNYDRIEQQLKQSYKTINTGSKTVDIEVNTEYSGDLHICDFHSKCYITEDLNMTRSSLGLCQHTALSSLESLND